MRYCAVLLILILASAPGFADRLTLSDGSTIEGFVLSEAPEAFNMLTVEGTIAVPRNRIRKVAISRSGRSGCLKEWDKVRKCTIALLQVTREAVLVDQGSGKLLSISQTDIEEIAFTGLTATEIDLILANSDSNLRITTRKGANLLGRPKSVDPIDPTSITLISADGQTQTTPKTGIVSLTRIKEQEVSNERKWLAYALPGFGQYKRGQHVLGLSMASGAFLAAGLMGYSYAQGMRSKRSSDDVYLRATNSLVILSSSNSSTYKKMQTLNRVGGGILVSVYAFNAFNLWTSDAGPSIKTGGDRTGLQIAFAVPF